MFRILLAGALVLGLPMAANAQTDGAPAAARQDAAAGKAPSFKIPFEKHVLDNGLEVILHVDRSDPVVAISLAAHVGSGRELPGRTGFAHLFEHLLFLDSENLGPGGLDAMSTRIGGSGTNGFTTNDITIYFQSAPSDSLEKLVWAEAEKIGYFISTVTQPVLDSEREVVKNEKRENVDLQPYGRHHELVSETLYPADHPYHWDVIGSLDDLQAATLEDVRNFYSKWYGPGNVTVALAGDFDPEEALALVRKYFGHIPARGSGAPIVPRAATVEENVSLVYEDPLAKLPRLTMIWPAVPFTHRDSVALGVLSNYLATDRTSPLYRILVEERRLTTSYDTYTDNRELAGEFHIQVSANEGGDLDEILPAIEEALVAFEAEGVDEAALAAIKAGREVDFLAGREDVLNKAISLSEVNAYYGDPAAMVREFEEELAVTTDDLMRVYRKYIKDKPYIATSFVPQGELATGLAGAVHVPTRFEPLAEANEETEESAPETSAAAITPAQSKGGGVKEPAFGAPFDVASPEVWRTTLANGTEVYGIENDEVPLVYFTMRFKAGSKYGDIDKVAVARLTASMLNRGTAEKTPQELQRAIRALGAEIFISSGLDWVGISGSTLARRLDETVALAEEMLLEPRWDEAEFAILKQGLANGIARDSRRPGSIASREKRKLTYPEGHLRRFSTRGDAEQLETITLADLKTFYAENYQARDAMLAVAGDVDSADVERAFSGLVAKFPARGESAEPLDPQANPVERTQIYFYDIPGASQSIIQAWRPSISARHPDYTYLSALNFLLGGAFTSDLNQILRVEKGFTYGAGSGFSASDDRGQFSLSANVRADATRESLATIDQILRDYGENFTQERLDLVKSALIRRQALQNETLGAKLAYLRPIMMYGYDENYMAERASKIEAMSLDQFKELVEDYVRPDALAYLVVGDAKTQLEGIRSLGLGEVTLLEKEE